MGNVIHMETEEVRAMASQLDRISAEIFQEIVALGSSLRALNWQSPSRDKFINDYAELQQKIQRCAEQGAALGARVQREADEWEQAASTFVAGGLTPEQKRAQAVTTGRQSIRSKWREMSFEERKKWLEDYYKSLCTKLGMEPIKFNIKDLNGFLGKFIG